MEPKLFQVSPFTVSGPSARTNNYAEADSDTAQLAPLWDKFLTEGTADKIPQRVPDSPVFGVYSDYESDETGMYTLTAGVRVSEPNPDYSSVEVPGGRYLVFAATGPMPDIAIETWMGIWTYFSKSTEYKRSFETDFELFPAENSIDIHIAIQPG